MKRFVNFGRVAAGLALAATVAFAPTAKAQHLGNDTIALFPKNVGEFAYANLKMARSQKWFPQLQEQMLPERFRQFERFLASAGVDPNSQVEEVAWGLIPEGVTAKTEGTGSTAVPTGEEIVGVALGNTIRIPPKHFSNSRSYPPLSHTGPRCTPSAAAPVQTIFSFCSSIRARPHSDIAPSWKKC